MKKDTIIIPDIHGRIKTLEQVLKYFPKEDYDYIFLGDLVDRGPNSKEVVATVTELLSEGHARLCKGNHEMMMLDALVDPTNFLGQWSDNGGTATWDSFEGPRDAYSALLTLLGYAEDYIVLDSTLYSHAARPLITKGKVVGSFHIWNRPSKLQFGLPEGVTTSVHGHTPMEEPTEDEATDSIYIDLGLKSLCVMSHNTRRLTRFKTLDKVKSYSPEELTNSYFKIQHHLNLVTL